MTIINVQVLSQKEKKTFIKIQKKYKKMSDIITKLKTKIRRAEKITSKQSLNDLIEHIYMIEREDIDDLHSDALQHENKIGRYKIYQIGDVIEKTKEKNYFANEKKFEYGDVVQKELERLKKYCEDFTKLPKKTKIDEITRALNEKFETKLDYSYINELFKNTRALAENSIKQIKEMIKIIKEDMPVEQKKEKIIPQYQKLINQIETIKKQTSKTRDELNNIMKYLRTQYQEQIEQERLKKIRGMTQKKYPGIINMQAVQPTYTLPENTKDALKFLKTYYTQKKEIRKKIAKDLIQAEVLEDASKILNMQITPDIKEDLTKLLSLVGERARGQEAEFIKTLMNLKRKSKDTTFLLNLDKIERAEVAFVREIEKEINIQIPHPSIIYTVLQPYYRYDDSRYHKENEHLKKMSEEDTYKLENHLTKGNVRLADTTEEFGKNLVQHGGFGTVFHSLYLGNNIYAQQGTINRKKMPKMEINNEIVSLVDPLVNKARWRPGGDSVDNQHNHLAGTFSNSKATINISGNAVHAKIREKIGPLEPNPKEGIISKMLIETKDVETIEAKQTANKRLLKKVLKNVRVAELTNEFDGTFIMVLNNKP